MFGRKDNGYTRAMQAAFAAVAVFVVFSAVSPALAATTDLGLNPEIAQTIGLTTTDIRTVIGNIVRIFLGLLGLVAVSLMIYAGFLYMTAAGNEDQVAKAKQIIVQATIGLVIITSAYAITYFIFRALDQGATGGIFGTEQGGSAGFGAAARGSSALGHGVLAYHYPEPGQTDIPRNTKIAITFKKALKLSTVFKDYDDNNTPQLGDDKVNGSPVCTGTGAAQICQTVKLNTDNIKLIANQSLGTGAPAAATEGKTADDLRFEARYPDAGIVTDVNVSATEVGATFNPAEEQTIILKPVAPIGSATADVNYRTALRGGDNGIKIWSPKTSNSPATCTADPCAVNAFAELFADGSYYWTFTTSTTLDTSPPKVTAIVPPAVPSPANSLLDRNQIIQIYFDEPIDPTSVTGTSGAGFTKITIRSKPADNPAATAVPVPGTFVAGNGYRAVEFVPSAICEEGAAVNSCGEPVYCLPKNSRLEITVKAATVGTQPPQASAANGVVDMVDNSLDGNGDGTAQGPVEQPGTTRSQEYAKNAPQADLSSVSDSVAILYNVGSNIDLVPPEILATSPVAGDASANAGSASPSLSTPFDQGPSNMPPDAPIIVQWSKTMMLSSMRTGVYPPVPPAPPTIMLQAKECRKSGGGPCIPVLDPPAFFPTTEITMLGNDQVTNLIVKHRVFFTASDLGYTDDDINANPSLTPKYLPIIGSQMRDTKQNCFFPSKASVCEGGAAFCCNRDALDQAGFQNSCEVTGQ